MNKIDINRGFTLSEVVITLIIIGVVAAITIPMLNNDVNDKKWNVARQKAQATIGEAFKLAIVNDYVTPEYDNTKDFVTKVLTKYLKINKQCDTAQACGFSSSIKKPNGSDLVSLKTSWTDSTPGPVMSQGNGSRANAPYNTVNGGIRAKFNNSTFFQTIDGFSVNFFFNPYCAVDIKDKWWGESDDAHFLLDDICMNAVYDMNGKQGPNQVGKDIGFVGAFWNGYSVKAVAVLPYKEEHMITDKYLPGTGNDYWARTQQYCRELHENDWKVPDIEETGLLAANANILSVSRSRWFWTSVINVEYPTMVWMTRWPDSYYNDRYRVERTHTNDNGRVLCVRTNSLK